MNTDGKTNRELDDIYNNMRMTLGLEPAGKSKDKTAAIARIEKLEPEYRAKLNAKPARKSVRRKGFNYPLQSKVLPPSRNGTKFATFVDMLLSGATKAEMMAEAMRFTEETIETTEEMASIEREKKKQGLEHSYTTSTWYRTWRDITNLAVKNGYGMRWLGGDNDNIMLFDNQSAMDEWDRNNGN